MAGLRRALRSVRVSGEPTDSELGLLDWRPGGGATWFLPATPMVGEVAQLQQETSRRILTEHGFEYAVEFVCGSRAARALHIMLFDRTDVGEVARMSAAYDALVAAYDELGYPIGRTPTDQQEWAMRRQPELRRLTSGIKSALDPNGILAPTSTASSDVVGVVVAWLAPAGVAAWRWRGLLRREPSAIPTARITWLRQGGWSFSKDALDGTTAIQPVVELSPFFGSGGDSRVRLVTRPHNRFFLRH